MFATVQCSVVFAACSAGFGQSLPTVPEHSRNKVQQVSVYRHVLASLHN
jgi:hypothetical protein